MRKPTMTLTGPLIGLGTFLCIGMFHPIVIKTEFYFGTKPWWVFLIAGIGCIVGALFIQNVPLSAMLGVAGFSCLWSILEIFEQHKRVEKGWFPAGPGHKVDNKKQ